MKKITQLLVILFVGVMAVVPVAALAGAGSSPAEVSGVLGLRPVEAQSSVAIWVPIPDGRALSGFMWYNNECAKQSLGRGEVL